MRYIVDLDAHEQARLAAVLAGCGDLYDPARGLADECAAYQLLHSNLDADQRATLALLQMAGVLPPL